MAPKRVNSSPPANTKKIGNTDSKVKTTVGKELTFNSKSKYNREACVRSKSAGHETRSHSEKSPGKVFFERKLQRLVVIPPSCEKGSVRSV